MDNKKKIFDVGKLINDEMNDIEIPESLSPENMKKKLENETVSKVERSGLHKWITPVATAACMVILISAGIYTRNLSNNNYQKPEDSDMVAETVITEAHDVEKPEIIAGGRTDLPQVTVKPMEVETADAVTAYKNSKGTYDAIYKMYQEQFNERNYYYTQYSSDGVVMEDMVEESTKTNTTTTSKSESAGMDFEESENTSASFGSSGEEYSTTNVQVENVDEGDIAKNDGRYLYQIISGDGETEIIQIIDTKNGLEECVRISGFSDIIEFYVQDDKLVVLENLWVFDGETEETGESTKDYYASYSTGNSFCRVHFYDIADRSNPKSIRVFNVKGNYQSSRISDGYLYFFCNYSMGNPESKEDIAEYIPLVDGKYLTSECLYLPDEADSMSYLMMLSVDLSAPAEFADKQAIVSSGNYFYVSEKNIYVLDYAEGEAEGNFIYDKTQIVRFSYSKGDMEPQAEGLVKGNVLDQFSMDENDGYFRIITTVNGREIENVRDDVSGDNLGYTVKKWLDETNSVYVLNEALKVIGKIENLAEDERVYSARFMGDMGYFVTFRQTDPLFSVDFTDPYNPKILGELKITGFSEYLHFYDENILVGIGYEADPDTGITDGVKLSMFDISDPTDVKEINKLVLDEFDYSCAFDNHNAVLVSTSKNLIGFEANSYSSDGTYYLVFDIDKENGFTEKMRIEAAMGYNYNFRRELRGTYIGDIFYLLKQDNGVESYDLNTGKLLKNLINP